MFMKSGGAQERFISPKNLGGEGRINVIGVRKDAASRPLSPRFFFGPTRLAVHYRKDIPTMLGEIFPLTTHSFTKVPKGIMRGNIIGRTEKVLLLAILDAWNVVGEPTWFFLSNTQLCLLSGLSKSVAFRARKRLLSK